MAQKFSVSLKRVIKEFSLEEVFVPENIDEISVSSADLNRPGLQLSGFYDYFDNERIQIIGKNEDSFLETFIDRQTRIERLLSRKPPAARALTISPEYCIPPSAMMGLPHFAPTFAAS